MRRRLAREAEAELAEVLAERGAKGNVTVLGDTGILGVCGATSAVRSLYDATLSGLLFRLRPEV